MERWKKLLIDASTRLTKIKWLASNMFNHFVINHVIDDPVNKFEIADDNALVTIIRLCFTVLTDAPPKKDSPYSEWIKVVRTSFVSVENPLLKYNRTGIASILSHLVIQYKTVVKNHLIFGLRNNYLNILKKEKVKHHKEVAARVLSSFVVDMVERRSKSKYKLEVHKKDEYWLRKKIVQR